MHKRMLVVSLVVALLTPAVARAGFTAGARLGWAIPGGDITKGIKLSDQIDGQVPLWLDLGWSFDRRLALGVYFRYAANVRDSDAIGSCDFLDANCGGYGLGAGGQVTWRFLSPTSGPWIGAFGGFEALSFEARLGNRSADQAFRGWEVGGQGGIDFAWGPLVLGPYVVVGVGRYTVVDLDLGDVGGPVANIPDDAEANHTWINLGLRAAFNF